MSQTREQQLASMDRATRASALAQEHTVFWHPRITMTVHFRDGQNDPTMTRWLRESGHPRAEESYVTSAPPGRDASFAGRGPDGEPAVMLHPERRNYGTLAHETAHLVHDFETGRRIGDPVPPGGAHNDRWAGHYARFLDDLSPGAGGDFLEERSKHLDAGAVPEYGMEPG